MNKWDQFVDAAQNVLVALRMRNHRPNLLFEQPGNKFVRADRNMAMGEFEQHDPLPLPIAYIGYVIFPHPGQYVVIKPNLGSRHDLKRNALDIKRALKFLRCLADIGRTVLVTPGMHVGRDNRDTDSGGNCMTGKAQGLSQILGTVVDPGKEMAVKINHAFLEEYPLL